MRNTKTARTIIAAIFAGLAGFVANAAPADPPVPPGRDPGGRAIAMISAGINYTRPHIAQMLARDGEGEIIGYDFVDDDRRPFAAEGDTSIAELVIGEGQATTLIVLRAALADTVRAGRAIKYATDTQARITLVSTPPADASQSALISAAASHFSKHLFIVPAGDATAALETRANLIVVAAAPAEGDKALPVTTADILTPSVSETGVQTVAAPGTPAALAAARIAALAARLQAVEPELAPDAAKLRILSLAEPLTPPAAGPRLIANPRRHFWLE
ncbi:MAG: hypothetical protein ABL893_03480 [Hyphomicrobium sp.]